MRSRGNIYRPLSKFVKRNQDLDGIILALGGTGNPLSLRRQFSSRSGLWPMWLCGCSSVSATARDFRTIASAAPANIT